MRSALSFLFCLPVFRYTIWPRALFMGTIVNLFGCIFCQQSFDDSSSSISYKFQPVYRPTWLAYPPYSWRCREIKQAVRPFKVQCDVPILHLSAPIPIKKPIKTTSSHGVGSHQPVLPVALASTRKSLRCRGAEAECGRGRGSCSSRRPGATGEEKSDSKSVLE
jgi:hypothetical protein